MRINRLQLDGLGLGQTSEVHRPAPSARREASDTRDAAATHSTSPELVQWVSLATQEPEIRNAAVEQAQERLVAGDYLTPEAAYRTAHALLTAVE